MKSCVCAAIFCLSGCLSPPIDRPPDRESITLDGVTLITPRIDRAKNMRLTIQDGYVLRIESESTPNEFHGLFVLPGLIDMHAHFPSQLSIGVTESASLMYLASGVTTIRNTADLGGSAGITKKRINEGAFPGPRVFFCGPAIDGDPPSHPLTQSVSSPEETEKLVIKLIQENHVDCLKVYSALSVASLRKVRSLATKYSLPLIGHVPVSVTLADSGLDDAQHLYGIGEKHPVRSFADTWGGWKDVDSQKIQSIIESSLTSDMAHTPTLITFKRLSQAPQYAQQSPPDEALPRYFHEIVWHPEKGFPAMLDMQPQDYESLSLALPKMRDVVYRMYKAGVTLHLGSDTFMPYVRPGESLLGEMAEFVNAGIPLEDVWSMATWRAGQKLGVPRLGLIDAGAPADFLIFREDPTKSLDALETLEYVIADGRIYSAAILSDQLERYKVRFNSWNYRLIMRPLISVLYWLLR